MRILIDWSKRTLKIEGGPSVIAELNSAGLTQMDTVRIDVDSTSTILHLSVDSGLDLKNNGSRDLICVSQNFWGRFEDRPE